jgi:hypothetical protein
MVLVVEFLVFDDLEKPGVIPLDRNPLPYKVKGQPIQLHGDHVVKIISPGFPCW